MIAVKVVLKSGDKFFLKECYPYETYKKFEMVVGMNEATFYRTILEFHVAWRLLEKYTENSRDILKFEAVDDEVGLYPIDLHLSRKYNNSTCLRYEKKDSINPEWYSLDVTPSEFHALKFCRYQSCHYMSVERDGEWIAFPETNDGYNRVGFIRYYKRGLDAIIHDLFLHRFEKTIPYFYERSYTRTHLKLCFNPDILLIYLDNIMDCCANIVLNVNKQQHTGGGSAFMKNADLII